MPRNPEIQILQVEIYISTKRHQNPMEFRWFRDLFWFFQKRRVGPTLISRFNVCVYIYCLEREICTRITLRVAQGQGKTIGKQFFVVRKP